jgi:SAM-dependent methyltransferase
VELPDEERMRQSGPFPTVQHFYDSSLKSFRELLVYTELKPHYRVLDYGCGLGRLAIPLSAFLDPDQDAYRGVDTDRECVERNARVFARHGNMRFEHVNLYSTMYNKAGGSFDQLEGRDFGSPFDLAFLFSVFTHILPEDCDQLLRTLCRQLAPGAELFSSWFLLNEATHQAMADGVAGRDFSARHGVARVQFRNVPEGAVAYEEADVLERFAAAGLTDVRIHYGKWRGCEDSWIYQDIVLARMPGG